MSDAYIIWRVANGWACKPHGAPFLHSDDHSKVSVYPSFGEAVEWLERQGADLAEINADLIMRGPDARDV